MSQLDAHGKQRWDAAYRRTGSGSLWLDPPVPFAYPAAALLRELKASSVLEVPCGDAKNTAVLASACRQLHAVDASPTALRSAAARLSRETVPNCTLALGDASNLNFADETFDAVFCWDLLGHLEAPIAPMKEMLRVVKEGGVLIGSVFSDEDSTRQLTEMRHLGRSDYMYRESFFFRFYSRGDVDELLTSVQATSVSVVCEHWTEGPHPGYREYDHAHASWAFVVRKSR